MFPGKGNARKPHFNCQGPLINDFLEAIAEGFMYSHGAGDDPGGKI